MITKEHRINNLGFTLVELIVVLVIVAVLSAISVPALLSYIDEEKAKQEILYAKQFYTAAQATLDELYFSDTDILKKHNESAGNQKGTEHWSKKYSKMIYDLLGDPELLNQPGTSNTGSLAVLICGDNLTFTGRYYWECKVKSLMGISNPYSEYGSQYFPEGYPNNDMLKHINKRKAYTVYGILYRRSDDSPLVFYNGENWLTEPDEIKNNMPKSKKFTYTACNTQIAIASNNTYSGLGAKDENYDYLTINGIEIPVYLYALDGNIPTSHGQVPSKVIADIRDDGKINNSK